MPSNINPHEILQRTIQDGATLIPDHLSPTEVARIADSAHNRDKLSRNIPEIGRVVAELAWCLQDPIIGFSTDTIVAAPQQSSCAFHVDSVARRGISLLIPFSGPKATFHYAPHRQVFPDDMSESQSFSYGPGDIAVLRQGILAGGTPYPQTYHLGVASEDRGLLFYDIISDQVAHSFSIQ